LDELQCAMILHSVQCLNRRQVPELGENFHHQDQKLGAGTAECNTCFISLDFAPHNVRPEAMADHPCSVLGKRPSSPVLEMKVLARRGQAVEQWTAVPGTSTDTRCAETARKQNREENVVGRTVFKGFY